MHYTQELINEVKRLYPERKPMHEQALFGDKALGKSLDCPIAIMNEDIISATSLEELQTRAREYQNKVDLYNKWRKEWKNHQRLLKLKE